MLLRKIMWGLWLGLCFLLWILTENYGIIYLLAISVVIPLTGILWTLFASRNLEVSIALDAMAEKGEPLEGYLQVRNQGFLPCPKVSCKVICRNCFTGETAEQKYAVSVWGNKAEKISVRFTCGHCGRLELVAEQVKCHDLFGIMNRPVEAGVRKAALVLPDIYPATVVFTDRMQMDPEGQEYSMTKPGSDPSETFAIREYHPGDPVKNMHWKLSEKLDLSMVRELGLPINHSVLIAFDTSAEHGEELPNAEQKDAMGTVAASIAQYFCDQQIAHRLAWFDPEKGETQVQDVQDAVELAAALSRVLSVGNDMDTMSVLEHYRQETGNLEDAHVAVITAYPWPDLMTLQDEGRITVLLCGKTGTDWTGAFEPGKTAQVLRYIEV